jgi:hypothetical protein
MSGWVAVALLILVFVVIAVLAIRRATRRWWDYLIVLVLAVILIKPFYALTGDVSALLPDVWTDGPVGKDQIILVSIAATFLWPVIAAALAMWGSRAIMGKMRGTSR